VLSGERQTRTKSPFLYQQPRPGLHVEGQRFDAEFAE